MRFTQDSPAGINLVRGYGDGAVRLNDSSYRGAVIVSATALQHEPQIHSLDELEKIDMARILALDPELVLLGTGAKQIFPQAAFGAIFMRAGIGFEVMDTGAACRTYNVLIAERRRVVAMLLT